MGYSFPYIISLMAVFLRKQSNPGTTKSPTGDTH